MLDMAVESGLVKKSGSWFSYGETKLGQEDNFVKTMIEDNPELMSELEVKIKKKLYCSVMRFNLFLSFVLLFSCDSIDHKNSGNSNSNEDPMIIISSQIENDITNDNNFT